MYFLIFGLLLAFRIGLFIYYVSIEGQYQTPDSAEYISLASNLLERHGFSSSLLAPFEPNFFRTTGYPFFLAALGYLGVNSPYGVVFLQELIYILNLWIFYRYGEPLFGKKITRLGLLFLLVEPGGFAYPKLFLSEMLFLPFITLGLLLIGHYIKKGYLRYIFISGTILGLGMLIRPAILYLPIVIALTLIAFNFRSMRQWLHSGLFLLIVAMTVSPWIVRNFHHSGAIFMSGQQSNVLTYYHVPYVWKSAKGIPFSEGQKIMSTKVKAAVKKHEEYQGRPVSIIGKFKIQQDLAVYELTKYPVEYFKRWMIGVGKGMFGLSLTPLNIALKMPPAPINFDNIETTVFHEKVWQFLKGIDKVALTILIVRIFLVIFALLGAVFILTSKDCFLWIIMLTNFYFICSPGPLSLSRFRFPIEIFWFTQAYFGFIWVLPFFKRQWFNVVRLGN